MKTASYIFYALAVLSALAGISAASFFKEEMGQVFGSGTIIIFGGATLLCLVIGLASRNIAKRSEG
ncbi:MAG: hypothetical protein U9N56_01365 [Actinomycetota bacterium]|nr:hypothetical protein [Actinomycetota bacterium]